MISPPKWWISPFFPQNFQRPTVLFKVLELQWHCANNGTSWCLIFEYVISESSKSSNWGNNLLKQQRNSLETNQEINSHHWFGESFPNLEPPFPFITSCPQISKTVPPPSPENPWLCVNLTKQTRYSYLGIPWSLFTEWFLPRTTCEANGAKGK